MDDAHAVQWIMRLGHSCGAHSYLMGKTPAGYQSVTHPVLLGVFIFWTCALLSAQQQAGCGRQLSHEVPAKVETASVISVHAGPVHMMHAETGSTDMSALTFFPPPVCARVGPAM